MDITDNYRYPGFRPFQDTDYDRSLFFGREKEQESLLHLVLSESLVVLFGKSGMGKTSLLNAGLLNTLREKNFIPLQLRFNDPEIDPLQALYIGIEKSITQCKKVEYIPGKTGTLWQYFKTAEFWSDDDVLMTPILVLDQFEEFFTFHSMNRREIFIRQFVDLFRSGVPKELWLFFDPTERIFKLPYAYFSYDEPSPNVKIVISIREEFLANLQEIAYKIPNIFQHRFRLLALRREQASQAIVEPAKVDDEQISTAKFRYTAKAVKAMLNFLCKKRRGNKMVTSDEVEPFQLQILCQHIENIVWKKAGENTDDLVVEEKDLKGESGMRRVLEEFYDRQIESLGSSIEEERVHNLFEDGLINEDNRRVSLEVKEIEKRFGISKQTLEKLVDSRLLRAEHRLDSVYYELSHDTLVEPIRNSQRKHSMKRDEINELLVEAAQLKLEGKVKEAKEKYQRIIVKDDKNIEAYLELGQLYFEQGRLNKAITTYRQAIRHGITNALIYYKLGKVRNAQGTLDEAMKNYQKAIVLDREFSAAYRELGNIYRDKERFEEAREHYENALDIDKENGDTYKEMAILYIKQGKYDQAIDVYRDALDVGSEYAYIYDNLIKAIREEKKTNGNVGEIIDTLREIACSVDSNDASLYFNLGNDFYDQGIYEKAHEYYKKAIQCEPEWAYPYWNTGVILEEQKNYDEAIANYEKAVQYEPHEVIFCYGLGEALYDAGRYEEAVPLFNKVIQLDPHYRPAYTKLIEELTKQGRYTEIIELSQKAIQNNPNFEFAYKSLGDAFAARGEYERAIQFYDKLIQRVPNSYIGYDRRGSIFTQQEKYAEAIHSYNKAIEINPDLASAHEGLGDIYLEQKQYDKAVEYYEQAIRLEPNLPSVHNRLGDILRYQGKYDKAIKYYQKSIQLEPDSPYAYNGLANIFAKQGKYDEAINYYNKVIEIDPELTHAYNGLAEVFEKQDNYDEAIENYEKSLQLDPENIDLRYKYQTVLSKAIDALSKQEDEIERQEKTLQEQIKILKEKEKYDEIDIKLKEINTYNEEAHAIQDKILKYEQKLKNLFM